MNLYGYGDGDPLNNSDPFGLYSERQGTSTSIQAEQDGEQQCRSGYVWAPDIAQCVNPETGEGYDPIKEAQEQRRKAEEAKIDATCTVARNAAIQAVLGDGAFFFSFGANGAKRLAALGFWAIDGATSEGNASEYVPVLNSALRYREEYRACRGLQP